VGQHLVGEAAEANVGLGLSGRGGRQDGLSCVNIKKLGRASDLLVELNQCPLTADPLKLVAEVINLDFELAPQQVFVGLIGNEVKSLVQGPERTADAAHEPFFVRLLPIGKSLEILVQQHAMFFYNSLRHLKKSLAREHRVHNILGVVVEQAACVLQPGLKGAIPIEHLSVVKQNQIHCQYHPNVQVILPKAVIFVEQVADAIDALKSVLGMAYDVRILQIHDGFVESVNYGNISATIVENRSAKQIT